MTVCVRLISLIVRRWLWNVGWWSASSLDEWSWHPKHFRLRFWRTPTNALNRFHREMFRATVQAASQEIQSAYAQGLRDGAFQYADLIRARDTKQPPSTWYVQ